MTNFDTTRTVRMGEVDAAGVVYFARFFDFAHEALEDFFHHIGLSFAQVFKEGLYGFPLVHTEADFKAPAKLGDQLVINLTIEDLGETSFAVRYAVTGPQGQSLAQLQTRHAWISLKEFRSTPIPAAVRDLLKPYLTV